MLSLRRLVLSPRWKLVSQLMYPDVTRIRADADQETAARLLDKHNYLALPVVDEQDRLLGIITADDAADVLLEEAGEDIERLGGSQPLEEPYLRASIFHLFRKRVFWLLVLFVGGAFTGSVLNHFESVPGSGSRADVLHPAADRHRRERRLADGDDAGPRDGRRRGAVPRHLQGVLARGSGRAAARTGDGRRDVTRAPGSWAWLRRSGRWWP